ncbi:hypothetical protein IE81DRAFT_117310 [Ceraceosorus guamensis]|uniref:FYVE zinc finger domain-containing protein n=1 Tax=Ceraceosorus guamensis TaxID=1522189 RepID=A0A316VYW4_9BASI|nr:hypothetical protein IE81DRAFT_117310 [Ceraceosorus guamensis]PWN42649.1 hypothetical protein IE81DRAFT_117310 [Ceraceosorus guamensis]
MNAAAGGHLPVVRYLCSKWNADPFARNAAGETAYDVAAATFETFVSEVLDKYETERWAALRFSGPPPAGGVPTGSAQGAYNPLRLHTTVPIVLHENQRLDTRLSTLAVHGGKPRWSGTSAGRPHKPDRRAPGTMPPGPLSSSRSRNIPMRREDVGLPTRENPYKLVLPTRSEQIAAALARRQGGQNGTSGSAAPEDLGSTPTPQSVLSARAAAGTGEAGARDVPPQSERSHFWLSDWQTDLTHPLVDADEGWQYAQSFDAPDERWTAAIPPPLSRILEGKGLGASVSRAVTGGLLPGPGQTSINGHGAGHEQEAVATGWVRRRRWVRVMRRRLDIEIGDELEAAELAHFSATLTATGGTNGPSGRPGATFSSVAVIEAEQAAREACLALGPSADYLARSKALAGESAAAGSTPADALGEGVDELRRRIARLDLAVAELRASAFSDEDADRRSHAEDMLKEYTLQLGQLRQAAGLEEGSEDGDSDEDEDFIYPNSYKDDGQSVITRLGPATSTPTGARPALLNRQSSTGASVFGAIAPSEAGTSITAMRSADLAASSEFRVPQNERPNRPSAAGAAVHALREQNLVPTWQSDSDVADCPDCQRKFTFFLRKVSLGLCSACTHEL